MRRIGERLRRLWPVIVVTCSVLLGARTAAAVVVGQWLFDDGGGDVAKDTSGNKNHGKINNAKWADGKFGKALEFSGAASNVEITHAPVLSVEQFSLMGWVNVPALTGGWQTIVTQNTDGPTRNYGIFVNNNGGVIHYSLPRISANGSPWLLHVMPPPFQDRVRECLPDLLGEPALEANITALYVLGTLRTSPSDVPRLVEDYALTPIAPPIRNALPLLQTDDAQSRSAASA
jgi:hypothetical protein